MGSSFLQNASIYLTGTFPVTEQMYQNLKARGTIQLDYVNHEGLPEVAKQVSQAAYGGCPRVLCRLSPVIPIGLSDTPRQSFMRFYCPLCEEAYNRSEIYCKKKGKMVPYKNKIDGALFGIKLARSLMQGFPELKPEIPLIPNVPLLFGFRINGYESIIEQKIERKKRDHEKKMSETLD